MNEGVDKRAWRTGDAVTGADFNGRAIAARREVEAARRTGDGIGVMRMDDVTASDDSPSQYDDCGATTATVGQVWQHPGRDHCCIKQTGHAKAGDKPHECERLCGEMWITNEEQ